MFVGGWYFQYLLVEQHFYNLEQTTAIEEQATQVEELSKQMIKQNKHIVEQQLRTIINVLLNNNAKVSREI